MIAVMRLRAAWQNVYEVGLGIYAVIYIVAFIAVAGSLLLMGFGLGLEDASKLAGVPLPDVHDDPTRIEWGGLALLVGYGVVAVAAIAGLLWLAQYLPRLVRRGLGWLVVTAFLLWLTVFGVVFAVRDHEFGILGIAFFLDYYVAAFAFDWEIPCEEEDLNALGRFERDVRRAYEEELRRKREKEELASG